METTVRRTTPKYATRPIEDATSDVPPFQWHPAVVVFGAVAIMVGVYWDISWHMSIGRDSFWTPAHLLIQAGGLIAGISSGYVALNTTFGANPKADENSVTFWGFRAPLGAWVAIWGCLAMVTSAPFDNWWHNAYGLDVRIISPPHFILALGIFGVGFGALLLSLAQQNRSPSARLPMWLFLVTCSLLLMDRSIMLTEYSYHNEQRNGFFYIVSLAAYPAAVVLTARASKMKWGATISALIFTAIMLGLMWFIQLFPATPKLGPIYQNITHMVAMQFPVWVIVPSIGVDLVMQRVQARPIILAPILSAVFLLLFLAVQWPWSGFMLTESARNAIFNADNFVYWATPVWVETQRQWAAPDQGALPFVPALGVAFLWGTLSSFVGLLLGRWMTKVRR